MPVAAHYIKDGVKDFDPFCGDVITIGDLDTRKDARWRPRALKSLEGKWIIERQNKRRIEVRAAKVFSVEDRFMELARAWKKETAMFSLVRDKIINSNYLEIIGLGRTFKETIVKLILKDLEKGEEFWHYALKSITDSNPVPKGMVNNLSIVRDYWLDWGRDQHII